MPSLNHTHTYQRVGNKKSKWFRCGDPDCSHKILKTEIANKSSLCNQCHEKFVLSGYDLTVSKPRCNNCKQTKEAIEFKKKRLALEEIGIL